MYFLLLDLLQNPDLGIKEYAVFLMALLNNSSNACTSAR